MIYLFIYFIYFNCFPLTLFLSACCGGRTSLEASHHLLDISGEEHMAIQRQCFEWHHPPQGSAVLIQQSMGPKRHLTDAYRAILGSLPLRLGGLCATVVKSTNCQKSKLKQEVNFQWKIMSHLGTIWSYCFSQQVTDLSRTHHPLLSHMQNFVCQFFSVHVASIFSFD